MPQQATPPDKNDVAPAPRGIQAALLAASIRRRGVVLALAVLLALLAANVARTARTDVFPEFAAKMVKVQTEAPGLSPEQVELLVTDPLEAAASGLLGVRQVASKSLPGISILKLYFEADTRLQDDRWRVAQHLASVQLPPGTGPPRLIPLTSSTGTVLMAGLTSAQHGLMQLQSIAQWTLRPQLMAVPGVANVLVFSQQVRALQVRVDPQALLRHGLDPQQVVAATRHATGLLGAGFMPTPQQRVLLVSSGTATSPGALADTVLQATPDGVVTLGDVAQVGYAPLPAIGGASIGGQPAVILKIQESYGANTVQVTRGVQAVLERHRASLAAQGIELHADLFRPADFITLAMHNVRDSLLLGALLVVLVIALTLLDWRAALISSLAIPLSLLAAVAVLVSMGVTLNVMTLGGLAIAIGVVVDDAVIDVENILRRLRDNAASAQPQAPLRVILAACLEVRGAVVYATAAVLLVIVPVLLLPGLSGRLFSPLAQSYALAVLASLLVALTVTPALSALLLAGAEHRLHIPAPVRVAQRGYGALLRRLLPHWLPAALFTALLIGAAAWLAQGMGGSFLPPLQEGQFIVHMRLAPGASITASLDMGARVSQALERLPEVRLVAQHTGRATLSPDASGTQSSSLDVNLKPGADSDRALAAIERVLRGFAGATFRVNSFLTERMDNTVARGAAAPLVVNVLGNHLHTIDSVAAQVASVLRSLPGATGVQVQAPPGVPQLDIALDAQALRRWGLQPLPVLQAIHTAFAGNIVGTVFHGAVPVPVRVVMSRDSRDNPLALGALLISTPALGMVPLAQLAHITAASGPSDIRHLGGQRVQAVLAGTTSADLTGFVQQARAAIARHVALPPGVTLQFEGEAQQRSATLRRLAVDVLGVLAALVLLLAMALHRSSAPTTSPRTAASTTARQVALVLLSAPAAWTGGVFAAWWVGGVLSLGAVIGLLALMGISLRNAILIFTHAAQLQREHGLDWNADLLRRAVADRLAAIVMTSLVTALGVLPLALGLHAPGREIEGPMAVALLGGLATSLLYNLFALPALALRFGMARSSPPASRSLESQTSA
ncbi:efflux RND transporter permease subunit [Thiomonas bhubaneswarensis]|uniref:Cu/Ag efflux pump CusA n=1 Tax=Thiomonas bhubaneswarensis TaxID=339866 RepID=A0A0K6HZF5_9BURK|nr:efflux RND transporter permease subunit [Thiomonas bhubaneswarensis]CUA96193.1 Cu/Ag efflux pump CusA [Thiomonas bhubaneswarensis]